MVQSQEEKFTISKLAAHCDVGIETVRFYQRSGLLAVPQTIEGKTRRYGQSHVERLLFIKKAQLAGFPLREIKQLIQLDSTEERGQVLALAQARLHDIDRKIIDLKDARQALHQLINACQSAQAGPCPIIESFENPTIDDPSCIKISR